MKALIFIVTDTCNIACEFCAPDSGPHVKGHLDSDLMTRTYDGLAAACPVAQVAFSGGEPLLFRADVVATIRHVRARSDVPIRVVTNAFFGKTEALARTVLGELREAGLTEIHFSIDDFHEAFIPLKHVRSAIEVAVALGVPVHLVHKTFAGSRSSLARYEAEFSRTIPEFKYLSPAEATRSPVVFSQWNTLPIGRGAEKVDVEAWVSPSVRESDWRGPCAEVFDSVSVRSSGQLAPCCGLVDRRLRAFDGGDLRTRAPSEIWTEIQANVLYRWLRDAGPSAIAEALAAADPSLRFAGKYVLNCQICQEIFSDPRKREALVPLLARRS